MWPTVLIYATGVVVGGPGMVYILLCLSAVHHGYRPDKNVLGCVIIAVVARFVVGLRQQQSGRYFVAEVVSRAGISTFWVMQNGWMEICSCQFG